MYAAVSCVGNAISGKAKRVLICMVISVYALSLSFLTSDLEYACSLLNYICATYHSSYFE